MNRGPNLEAHSEWEREEELLALIKSLHAMLRQKKIDSYNRLLPFGELFGDRWEKARCYGFGQGSSIYDSSIVLGDVFVGANCWIGPNTILDGSGLLEIGDHCDVSAGTQIYTHDTVDRVIHGSEISYAPVKIGSHVYIGPNVVIAKGVSIGNHVIIGANSLVNCDIPSNSKGWGTPFKVKGECLENL